MPKSAYSTAALLKEHSFPEASEESEGTMKLIRRVSTRNKYYFNSSLTNASYYVMDAGGKFHGGRGVKCEVLV
jgi:hypothetical protein